MTPAQAIKIELKKTFPDVKFSCRHNLYAWGDSVDVERTNWPTEKEVKAIIGKYQMGSFDSMTDSYDYNNKNEKIEQTKYLFLRREIDKETKELVETVAQNYWGNEDEYFVCRKIREYLEEISIPVGQTVDEFQIRNWRVDYTLENCFIS